MTCRYQLICLQPYDALAHSRRLCRPRAAYSSPPLHANGDLWFHTRSRPSPCNLFESELRDSASRTAERSCFLIVPPVEVLLVVCRTLACNEDEDSWVIGSVPLHFYQTRRSRLRTDHCPISGVITGSRYHVRLGSRSRRVSKRRPPTALDRKETRSGGVTAGVARGTDDRGRGEAATQLA